MLGKRISWNCSSLFRWAGVLLLAALPAHRLHGEDILWLVPSTMSQVIAPQEFSMGIVEAAQGPVVPRDVRRTTGGLHWQRPLASAAQDADASPLALDSSDASDASSESHETSVNAPDATFAFVDQFSSDQSTDPAREEDEPRLVFRPESGDEPGDEPGENLADVMREQRDNPEDFGISKGGEEAEVTDREPADVRDSSLARSHVKPLPLAVAGESIDGGEERSLVPRPVGLVPTNARLAPLSRSQIALREKVRAVLRHYYQRPLNTGDRSPWEVMHALLAYEAHSRVLQGGPKGKPITAAGWLCFNQPCKGRTLLYLNNDQELRVRIGPALQGHDGQLLAMLAQSRIKRTYPMRVEGKELTIEDLIAMEKATCYPRTELTFKLIGLGHYLDLDDVWVNDQGMTWDFPTLLDEEMRQPVRTAACGGTHRLSGLTLAVKKCEREGRPVVGQYAKAARFVANYQNYAYRLQNPDGSLSTEWFRGPGDDADLDRRLKTTGHILEWLLYAASEKQLSYHRTIRAADYLATIMWTNRSRDWEAGPLGHAIHALVLFDRRVFAPHDGDAASNIAKRSNSAASRRRK